MAIGPSFVWPDERGQREVADVESSVHVRVEIVSGLVVELTARAKQIRGEGVGEGAAATVVSELDPASDTSFVIQRISREWRVCRDHKELIDSKADFWG